MKLREIFAKITAFFRHKECEENKDKDYLIKTVDVAFFDIPYSAFLVIRKYGWVVFFYKSINYAKELTDKYCKKIKDLYDQAVFSGRREGVKKMMLRIVNFIFYGKGVLNRREIRRRREKLKVETYGIHHIDALDVNRLKGIYFSEKNIPEVSIIIPVFNKWKFTYNCLDSLKKNITGISYEVIVVDDGSTDETGKMMVVIKNIVYIKNEKNLGFVGSCNAGAKKAKGKYVVFLNNDTSVKKNWLSALLKTFQNNQKIGLVGSKLIYPDGRLQEAGGIIWKNENAWNYGRFQNPNDPEFNYLKDVDYCSAASIMLPRDVFEKLGGFDVVFMPGYYEDSDLAFRVRQAGLRTVYQPKSELFHFEGITSGTDLNGGMKKHQAINQEKFFKRWGSVVAKENFNDLTDGPFLARDRSKNKKTVLVIDHYIPTFDKDAGSRTIFQYIKLLCDSNYNVKFIGDNFCKEEPYATALQQLGVEVLYGSYYAVNWENWVKENSRYIDFVLVNRLHVAVKYFDILRKYTNAKIIYYPVDISYIRERRQYEITKEEYLLKEIDKHKKLESYMFKSADVIVTISEYEKDVLNKEFPETKVFIIPTFIYDHDFPIINGKSFHERRDLLFVGGFSHLPNADGIKWFINSVFPMIKKEISDIKINIIGSNVPDEIRNFASENIKILGFVSDKELEENYSKSRIVVAPLRYGAGVKGKIIEAIAYGIPVVTTKIGAEGIIDKENILLVGNTEQDFAKKVIEVYNDNDLWESLRNRQIKHARSFLSKEGAKKIVENILSEA